MLFKTAKKLAHHRTTFFGLGNTRMPMTSNKYHSGSKAPGYDIAKDALDNFTKAETVTKQMKHSLKENSSIISLQENDKDEDMGLIFQSIVEDNKKFN